MKNFVLLIAVFLFAAIATAQTKSRSNVKDANDRFANIEIVERNPNGQPDTGGSGDTTWHSRGAIKHRKLNNGRLAIYSEPGKYTLYAIYKNKKLTGYTAVDAKGEKLNVNTVYKQAGGQFKCYVCVKVCNDAGKCAESCTEDPCPPDMVAEKASTNERPRPEDPDQGGEIFKKSERRIKQ